MHVVAESCNGDNPEEGRVINMIRNGRAVDAMSDNSQVLEEDDEPIFFEPGGNHNKT